RLLGAGVCPEGGAAAWGAAQRSAAQQQVRWLLSRPKSSFTSAWMRHSCHLALVSGTFLSPSPFPPFPHLLPTSASPFPHPPSTHHLPLAAYRPPPPPCRPPPSESPLLLAMAHGMQHQAAIHLPCVSVTPSGGGPEPRHGRRHAMQQRRAHLPPPSASPPLPALLHLPLCLPSSTSPCATRAVYLDPTTDVFMSYEGRAASLWGDAYLADADVVEHGGHVAPTSADTKMVRQVRGGSWHRVPLGVCLILIHFSPFPSPNTGALKVGAGGVDESYSESHHEFAPRPFSSPMNVHWWRAQAVFLLAILSQTIYLTPTLPLPQVHWWQAQAVCMKANRSHTMNSHPTLSLPHSRCTGGARGVPVCVGLILILPSPSPPPSGALVAGAGGALHAEVAISPSLPRHQPTETHRLRHARRQSHRFPPLLSLLLSLHQPPILTPLLSSLLTPCLLTRSPTLRVVRWELCCFPLSLPAYMLLAYRLLRALVDLRHVWLNTEAQSHTSVPSAPPPLPSMAQSVINETAHYPDWHFLFATNARQPADSERNREYDAAQSVAASLASALIAAQCDSFIGSLGSNWSRLINELRATGGRLYSGFVAMNLGEW
ncbi:unnamed protein product, partial [Closterium sp. Naga37s-1]